MAAKIKKGDKVVVLTGRDKGRSGEVIQVLPKEDRAFVRGINLVKKHQKQTQNQEGGIISKEAAIHLSNIAVADAEGRQADARWFPHPRRRPQGPVRQALGGSDRWLRRTLTGTPRACASTTTKWCARS